MKHMQSDLNFLALELAKVIEMGIERHLKSSIRYSPLRLFYSLFKKRNPKIIKNVRQMLANDIANRLHEIDNFNVSLFAKSNFLNDSGRLLRKKSYNIGINLMKKMTVKMAFRAFRDPKLQQKIYNFILNSIEKKTRNILIDYN